jgi:hypothetical protein
MSTRQKIVAVLIAGLWLISYTSRGEEVSPKPTISVSSIYNAEYAARFAVDGNPSTRYGRVRMRLNTKLTLPVRTRDGKHFARRKMAKAVPIRLRI